MTALLNKDYKNFLYEIKDKIIQAQYDALKKVNKGLIILYWDIGKTITQKQEEHKWGKSIVENLSSDLQKEFPRATGFSSYNLWRMRKFYLEYNDNLKLAPLVQEISWTNNIVIVEKCKDGLQREFYIKMTKKYGWTKPVLIHQIENQSYEKYLLNQTNFDKTLPEKYRHQAKLAVKDEFSFDFLELGDKHSERELESAILGKIREFLTEIGGYFTFIGNQYRIKLEEKNYLIDLLLFHRKLRCLVAVELKVVEFKPEFAGKMQFYLSLLNDKVKLEEENPSIGIIICKSKNRTEVEYTLKDNNQPIGVSSYHISKTLPKDLKGLLPTPEEIESKLKLLNE